MFAKLCPIQYAGYSIICHAPFIGLFLYLTQFPLVPDWPYYEVKTALSICRDDGNETNIYDAKEVVHQWVSYKKPY